MALIMLPKGQLIDTDLIAQIWWYKWCKSSTPSDPDGSLTYTVVVSGYDGRQLWTIDWASEEAATNFAQWMRTMVLQHRLAANENLDENTMRFALSAEPSYEASLAQYASAALQGMLAHQRRYKPRAEDAHMHWHDAIAKEAFEIARAMQGAREEIKPR